jgi:hypothetical protein
VAKDVYIDPPIARFEVGGRTLEDSLTQFNLVVDDSSESGAVLLLEGNSLETPIQFKIQASPHASNVIPDPLH